MNEFYITDDGIDLHLKLDMPETETDSLVILVHGFTGHMEETHIVGVKQAINKAGMAVLRAEMYGHGQSEGVFHDHTLFKWISNIMVVTDYALGLSFVKNLYLCGHSQGGLLTMLAAGMRPDDYKAIIPMSPAVVIPDGARNGNMLGISFDPDHLPQEVEIKDLTLGANYFRTAQMIYVDPAIKRYTKPVLIVHGDKDEAVPVSYSMRASKMYANCQFEIIPQDDHCYNSHLDIVCKTISDFLESQKNS